MLIVVLLFVQNNRKPASVQPNGIAASEDGSQDIKLPPSTLPVNEDGLIEAVFPKNLLGGGTAEDFYKDYLANSEYQKLVTDVKVNDDGTVSIFFTPNQLETYRKNIYNTAQYQKYYEVESIKEVIYENDQLTEITVLVDSDLYQQNGFERQMCNLLLSSDVGTYQILSGVPPDEWHTTITIKDVDTGDIVSKTDFPNEDMFRAK